MADYVISKYAIIRDARIITDVGTFVIPDGDDDGKKLKQIYKLLEVDYPKFYKMDRLSKLAFLTAEFLFKESKVLEKYAPHQVALIFSNASSSLNTDLNHNASIMDDTNYYPKPSVFVYTLPNIMLGEICIRHKLRGENVFFVSEKFNAEIMTITVIDMFKLTRHKACLIGRIDYDDNQFESSIFLIEQSANPQPKDLFTTRNLEKKFYKFAGKNIKTNGRTI